MSHHSEAQTSYFQSYLRVAPLALALWRAAEARAIASVELPRPLLDIGCGFGEFGGVFFKEPADVGLDIDRPDLRLARRRGCYRGLVQADGRRLPFSDGAFASVLSVSVLEHIPEAERVLPEVWRVLRPGGIFVFTTPSPKLRELLLYPRLLAALHLGPLGRWYARLVDRFLNHVSVKSLEDWAAALQQADLRVVEVRGTIPSKLTAAFDLTLPGALPSQLGRALGKGRWVWRPPGVIGVYERLLGSLVEEEGAGGCNLFFVAQKAVIP